MYGRQSLGGWAGDLRGKVPLPLAGSSGHLPKLLFPLCLCILQAEIYLLLSLKALIMQRPCAALLLLLAVVVAAAVSAAAAASPPLAPVEGEFCSEADGWEALPEVRTLAFSITVTRQRKRSTAAEHAAASAMPAPSLQ